MTQPLEGAESVGQKMRRLTGYAENKYSTDKGTTLPRLTILQDMKDAANNVATRTVVDTIAKVVNSSSASLNFRSRSKTAGGSLERNRCGLSCCFFLVLLFLTCVAHISYLVLFYQPHFPVAGVLFY